MKIEACIELSDGTLGPDPWNERYGVSLPLDHIICHDENGIPHRVREFVWPWTAYHPHRLRSHLRFYYWKTRNDRSPVKPSDITPAREARIREIQFLMVLTIYFNISWKETGFGALNGKLKSLWCVARFAESRDCTVRDILEQTVLQEAFIETLSGLPAVLWLTWLTFLDTLDPKHQLGFKLAKSKRWNDLRKHAELFRTNARQRAPLPTRVYGHLINHLRMEIEEIEGHADRLVLALRETRTLYQVVKASQPYNTADIGPAIIERNDLRLYLIKRGLTCSLFGLQSAVNELFLVCKIILHVFSGMRSEEARTLRFHCMITERSEHGRKHYLIAGVTTKLEGARRRNTKWVTTESEGFRAIRLAQRFASLIYEGLGITPDSDDKSVDASPLFPSTVYLDWANSRHNLSAGRIAPAHLHFSRARNTLIARLLPTIESSDIDELEEIDPFRSWRDEPEFAVGEYWPLTTHQLRRSLALYANASGLVRISSLRRQLQHLTREMSLYYGRGSAFCKDFVADDPDGYRKHLAPEWQDGNEEARILAFTMDVLNSKEPLFGGAGFYFQRRLERAEVMSRVEVTKLFKAGLINYTEGPLGGCTKLGACSKLKGLNLVDISCATDNCRHLIGKHSKIIQVIRLKRAALAQIDSNSIDYAMESEEIMALERVEIEWRERPMNVCSVKDD